MVVLAPKLARFDYIIIGGGASGCALATTLSQNATVLVLERGGGSLYNNPTATDIDNFANTALNNTPNSAGFYTHASDDYVEKAEWEMEEVEAAYEWVEKKLVYEPPMKGWQSARPKPKAYGVIYQDADGVFHKAELVNKAMNEVILSAGAIGSPQLLMLSGVGPEAHLKAHKINHVVLDHPMVGQGMGDNPMNIFVVPSPKPVGVSLLEVVGITKFDSFIEGCAGLSLSYNLTRRFFDGVLRLPNEESHSTQSNIHLFKSIDGLILQKVDGPLSRGHLELQNTNPNDNPSVTFNYYQDPEDLEKCVKGLRAIIKVINSNAFSSYKYPNATARELFNLMVGIPTNLRPRHVTSMFNLTQFCIDTVMTIWHYHGGCQVGRVVDKNYKVLGVDALRVIDGSTFLRSPGTNPQATVMMLGR
ncbi:hypothetical protein N665_0164s0036 [Sinapis alba]|nr:hypothetical protein N665_0164s0036 [Sinapis alba]